MKIKVVLLILVLIMLSACSYTEKNDVKFKKQKNYQIKEIKDGSNIKYDYIIYDNDHNEVDKGTAYRIKPRINIIDCILQLCISEGTGLQNCKYYDTEEKNKSKWFETPILYNKEFVVRLNELTNPTGIIVEDIFNKLNFYKEYSVNFSNNEIWPVKNIKFIDDNVIELTYISDNNSKSETKNIILNYD